MILPILHFGHPVLQQTGVKVREVTDAIRRLAHDMLETMYEARGVGLAAQQIGQAIQITVLDVRGTERPSQLFVGVREVALDSMLPLVLINPQITQSQGQEIGVEGCLSFPGITADISRASTVHVSATGLAGCPLQFVATGLLSRAVQHEIDHLNGILFIDRMIPSVRSPFEEDLVRLKKETLAALKKGHKGKLKA